MHIATKLLNACKQLYGRLVRALVYTPGLRHLPLRLPASEIMWPRNITTREIYETERGIYRLHDRMVRGNHEDLGKREYYIYRYIALKYRWPYIKELYDDEENVRYYEPKWLLPSMQRSRLVWWRRLSAAVLSLDVLLTVESVHNVLVDPTLTTGTSKVVGLLSVVVFLQLACWLLLLPARLFARFQMRSRLKIN